MNNNNDPFEMLNAAQDAVWHLSADISRTKSNLLEERRSLIAKAVADLEAQIEKIKQEISFSVQAKYQPQLDDQKKALDVAEAHLQECRKEAAKTVWLPAGTIVEEYASRYGKEPKKTGKKGVVAIYDGTQPLNLNMSAPKIGSLIVIHLKKDGTHGLNFEVVWSGLQKGLAFYSKKWQPEQQ